MDFVNAFATAITLAMTISAPAYFRPLLLGINYFRENFIVDSLQGHKYISVGVHLFQISGEDETLSLHTGSWKDVFLSRSNLHPVSKVV